MTMAVGWQSGPDDAFVADVLDAADLDRPDPADLHDPTAEPPPALLLAADPAGLPGQWVDAGMCTWFAQSNQTALAAARWMLEASRASADTSARVHGRPRAGKIVAASLGWSEAYATRLEFAHQILERLPALGEAMAAGVLEEHKADIFTTTLAELDTTQARAVVEQVLPDAPRLPFRVLRTRIEKAAQALDPDTGWTVIQTSPGRFAWTAPTGRSHIREPEPYDPLPDPIPRTDPADPAGLMFDPPPPTPPPAAPAPTHTATSPEPPSTPPPASDNAPTTTQNTSPSPTPTTASHDGSLGIPPDARNDTHPDGAAGSGLPRTRRLHALAPWTSASGAPGAWSPATAARPSSATRDRTDPSGRRSAVPRSPGTVIDLAGRPEPRLGPEIVLGLAADARTPDELDVAGPRSASRSSRATTRHGGSPRARRSPTSACTPCSSSALRSTRRACATSSSPARRRTAARRRAGASTSSAARSSSWRSRRAPLGRRRITR
jgi:hypothetical protein